MHTLRFNPPSRPLLQTQRMLTCRELLFPRFDLRLPRKRTRFHHPLNDSRQGTRALIDIGDPTVIALHANRNIVPIFLRLRRYSQFRNLWRGLITLQ